MDLLDKLITIRKNLNFTMEDIANKTHYSKKYIQQVERRAKPLTTEIIARYKEAFGVADMPLISSEETQFKDELYEWMTLITLDELENAKEQHPRLEKCAKLTLNSDIKTLFNIFSVAYYRKIKNNDALEAIMSQLTKEASEFTREQSHWYNRQVGISALLTFHYNEAIQAFLQAEVQGEKERLNDHVLYYNIGRCLTDMGFASKAIYYLEKARADAISRNQTTHNESIKCYLAENYNEVGRSKDALNMLNRCVHNEKAKKGVSTIFALIYRGIALVHLKIGDYKKALEYIDESLHYVAIGESPHEINLYYKATILLKQNKIAEGVDCVKECIKMEDDGTLHHVICSTLLHSTSLNNNESLTYIENVAIPKLKRHCKYPILLGCYQQLVTHYENKKTTKAFIYGKLAYELSDKLRKGDLT